MASGKRIKLTIAAVALSCLLLSTLNPGVRYRGRLVARKLGGETPLVSWTQIAIAMVPSPLRPPLRDLIGVSPALPPWIERLDYPTELDVPHKEYPVLDGPTAVMERLDCHVSVLQPGETPHPPHQHPQEELIVPISGTVEIIRVDSSDSGKQTSETIGRGQLVFHAANQRHTIRATGPGPSTYLVLKWSGKPSGSAKGSFASSIFDFRELLHVRPARDFETVLLFESATQHLGKLHAHVSTMLPGAGYGAHRDAHDIVIVVFTGYVEALDRRVSPDSLIFFPADRPHALKNPGDEPARYLVFEFHAAGAL